MDEQAKRRFKPPTEVEPARHVRAGPAQGAVEIASVVIDALIAQTCAQP